jgi:hypothetical protein
MQRFLYFAGFVYIALCGTFVASQVAARESSIPRGFEVPVDPAPGRPAGSTSGAQWFTSMKQYCNPVEVDVRERYSPPPATSDGAGYAAACFALAGKIDRARAIIEEIAPAGRAAAAGVLFEVAHPVADAGDDRASGPMMELVLEYWPNNYMALYHAGMSAYSLGQSSLAEKHLRAFLSVYNAQDGFTANARHALQSIEKANGGVPRLPVRRAVERDSSAIP